MTDQSRLSPPRLGAQGPGLSATTRLAISRLIGLKVDKDPDRGMAALRHAASEGDGDAAAMLAALHGMGAYTPQSWDQALDWLEQGARSGSETAQGQLRVLASETPAADPGDWAAMRRAIDLSPWLAAPSREALCDSPRVRLSKGIIPATACDWLIRQVRGRLRPALMYQYATKEEIEDPHRTCGDFTFDIFSADLILALTRTRVGAVTGLPVAHMEPPRVFHYGLGQEIKAHHDRCTDGVNPYGRGGTYQGDRIVTLLIYLNDDYEGGDLAFPRVGRQFRGQAGDAVYFAHVDPAGRTDPNALHAGLPIRRGEKYVLSQWIHDRPPIF